MVSRFSVAWQAARYQLIHATGIIASAAIDLGLAPRAGGYPHDPAAASLAAEEVDDPA